MAALIYSISLGADILIPPGNFEHLKYAVCHIDEVLDIPSQRRTVPFWRQDCRRYRDSPFMIRSVISSDLHKEADRHLRIK